MLNRQGLSCVNRLIELGHQVSHATEVVDLALQEPPQIPPQIASPFSPLTKRQFQFSERPRQPRGDMPSNRLGLEIDFQHAPFPIDTSDALGVNAARKCQ
ncbi:MAG: hypothetical protein DWH91_10135 [Planctomycetota bacterium]|nr:MAG: hypothetical protein DWH91_10135 [Planctomycetota bacterium]